MLHQPRHDDTTDRHSGLTTHHKLVLAAIAEAALPAGRVLPAADFDTVERAFAVYDSFPRTIKRAYRALLGALDRGARLTHGGHIYELPPSRRLEILEAWNNSHVGRRLSLRALLAPLKIAHFENPALYRHIGCVYEFERPERMSAPRYMRERVHGADELAGQTRMDIECDVVVVGSGAGGAVVAKELAEMGHAVVVLEEGRYFDRSDFTGRPQAMQRALYRNAGWTYSVGNAFIPIPLGVTVGGSTTINSGTCYRAPGRVLDKWRREAGLHELTEAHMEPYYERVERVLGVAPTKAEFLGGVARVIARGCDQLGLTQHKPLLRNAPECDGKGVCCFGCPTDAKRSTNVSYVPLALRAGAELFHGMRVSRILCRGERAVGVVAEPSEPVGDPGAPVPRLTVRARAVVIACGSIMTPVLLSDNRLANGSGQLGRNLTIHPATGGIGLFGDTIAGYNSVPQGYAIEDYHDEGLLFEGASAPLEIALGTSAFIGPELIELAEAWDRAAMFGFLIEDSSRGRVRSVRGYPLITYMIDRTAIERLQYGLEILSRVFLAAGAERVYIPVNGFGIINGGADLERFRSAKLHARDFDLTAYHPLGTARMGTSAKNSVVDINHQSHDVEGLYIVDGSVMPSSLAVNPQVTIMALATRAAERMDATLSS